MDAITVVFNIWQFQVSELEKRLRQIAYQPEGGRMMLAILLRNSVFDFLKAYAKSSEELRDQFRREQDALYEAELAKVRIDNGVGLDSGPTVLPIRHHDKDAIRKLTDLILKADHDFGQRLALEDVAVNKRLTKILLELQNTYEVNMRRLR